MYEDEEYGFCPECGALMKNGVCISCGYDRNKKDEKADGAAETEASDENAVGQVPVPPYGNIGEQAVVPPNGNAGVQAAVAPYGTFGEQATVPAYGNADEQAAVPTYGNAGAQAPVPPYGNENISNGGQGMPPYGAQNIPP